MTIAVSVLAFSFVGNTIFACLHECVHGLFHSRPAINEIFGCICAAFFPTGLSFQRTAHLNHHQCNRTPIEIFDYYGPSDNRVLKTIQWYGIISGVYWVTVPMCWFAYLVCPFIFRPASRHSKWPGTSEETGVPAYVRALCSAPKLRTRAELLFTIAFQVLLINLLDLTFFGWMLCYFAFGLQWSALQYADHAFSPLDVVEGDTESGDFYEVSFALSFDQHDVALAEQVGHPFAVCMHVSATDLQTDGGSASGRQSPILPDRFWQAHAWSVW